MHCCHRLRVDLSEVACERTADGRQCLTKRCFHYCSSTLWTLDYEDLAPWRNAVTPCARGRTLRDLAGQEALDEETRIGIQPFRIRARRPGRLYRRDWK